MEDDWDLQAVVRGCSSMSSSSSTTTTSSTTSLMANSQFNSTKMFPFGTQQLQDQIFTLSPDLTSSINFIEELNELYKPIFPKSDKLIPTLSPQSTTTTSSLSSISASIEQRQSTKQQQHKQQQQSQTKASYAPSVNNPRSKKRKNQIKRVCQIAAESISSDIWSWRKYGQKPIKGSPYPRGYYKCSSSKGCLARKQVERNRSDPTMFTVTYTAEHNHSAPAHRNSLAGSTRQKTVTTQSVITGDSNKQTTKPSSPANSIEEDLVLPENTDTENKLENLLGNEEEEEKLGFSDMSVSDDFFVGLEGLAVPATQDYVSG